jgi:hypothetical protein
MIYWWWMWKHIRTCLKVVVLHKSSNNGFEVYKLSKRFRCHLLKKGRDDSWPSVDEIYSRVWMKSIANCGWDLAESLKRLTANAKVATALGSIPVYSDNSGIWEAAEEAVLNKVHEKNRKKSLCLWRDVALLVRLPAFRVLGTNIDMYLGGTISWTAHW